MKAIIYFIISVIIIFPITLLFNKFLNVNDFSIQITISITIFSFLVKNRIKFNSILFSFLSINIISIFYQIFLDNIIVNFNSIFFKKLGLLIFSFFIIFAYVSIIFLIKILEIKSNIINIILILVNILFIVFSFYIFKDILYYSYIFYFFSLFFISYIIKTFIYGKPDKVYSIFTFSTFMFLFVLSVFLGKFPLKNTRNQENHNKTIINNVNKNMKIYKISNKEELFLLIKGFKSRIKIFKYIGKLIIKELLNIDLKILKPLNANGDNNKKKKNILLITIDALTPYHLDLYGYKRKTAPNLTKFAKSAMVFNKAITQGPNTRPAIASLITSKYVTEIYWTDRKRFIPLKQENLTFAEILKQEGYDTYGVLTHSYFLKRYGYNQGFDYWDTSLISTDGKIAFEQETAHRLYNKFKKIIKKMKKDEPNFIWLHFFDPHDNYVKRKEAKDWGDRDFDVYDNEINYTDIYLGKLFKFLKKNKMMDDFIIIITADHGEAFGRHGYTKHGKSVYNDQMWVPLIMKFPNEVHRVIEHEVAHIDIIPTVLDYLNIHKYDNELSGKSIFKKIKNNSFPPVYTLLFKKGRSQYSILYDGYKLNYFTRQDIKKLFDLRKDMDETHDISNEHPEVLYNLWSKLSIWIKKENKIYNMRNK